MRWGWCERLVSSPGHLVTGTVRGVLLDLLTTFVAAVDDATVEEVCGTRPNWFCETLYDTTGNKALAKSADWLITRPLSALIVIVVAALVNRWLRKLVTAAITRFTMPPERAVDALERIGVTTFSPDPRDATRTRTLCAVARASVSTLIWTIAVLVALGLFNINLGPLLAGAGIAGIAVGLGAQSLVRDCIAGFFMLLEDQCGVGDEVDLSYVSGTVEALTMRSTQVRAADGTLWTVPNGAIPRIGNQSRSWSQASVDVVVGLDADLDRVVALAGQAATAVCTDPEYADVVLREPKVLGVERVDQSGAVVRLTVRTTPGHHVALARAVRAAVKRALDDEGIVYHPPV